MGLWLFGLDSDRRKSDMKAGFSFSIIQHYFRRSSLKFFLENSLFLNQCQSPDSAVEKFFPGVIAGRS